MDWIEEPTPAWSRLKEGEVRRDPAPLESQEGVARAREAHNLRGLDEKIATSRGRREQDQTVGTGAQGQIRTRRRKRGNLGQWDLLLSW